MALLRFPVHTILDDRALQPFLHVMHVAAVCNTWKRLGYLILYEGSKSQGSLPPEARFMAYSVLQCKEGVQSVKPDSEHAGFAVSLSPAGQKCARATPHV